MRISTRLILFLVSAVVSVMAIYALVTISRTQSRMEEELVKMADHLGMALSVGVLHHLETGDSAGVAQLLETMERYQDVVSVAVFDRQGNPVAASGLAVTATGDGQTQVPRSLGGAPYTHRQRIVDAGGQAVGGLLLVITGQSLRSRVVEARNHILLTILALTIVISASIIYFARRHLAGPLARLTEGARAIGRGQLERRIEVAGDGEVAVLARAFNQMAVGLQRMTGQIVGEREYIRSVVDSMPEGVVVVDCENRVTAWNRTMTERYDRDAETVRGEPFETVMPGLVGTPFMDELQAVLGGHAPAAAGTSIRLPQDSERVLTLTASPLRGQEDGIDGAVLVFADVTERLRLEEQIQRSDKLAAVGQLAAGIAHEIGTPLNVISGNAEYLKMEHQGGEELQTIVDEVSRISDLVQRLMTFARHEDPKVEAVDVDSVVASVQSLMQHQMRRQGVEIDVRIEADLPQLAGDRSQLQQVLVNLVMNAWQAMPDGGTVTITGYRGVAPDDRSVVVVVADTGHGISPEQMPRIFEPFYTTKDVGEGTGLGLAIVQRIVEDHDGHLEIRSEVGHGTTVELRFPACAVPEQTHG